MVEAKDPGVVARVATGVDANRAVVVPEHVPDPGVPRVTVQATLHPLMITARPLVVLVVNWVDPVPVTPSVKPVAASVPPLVRST
jgi:hypothetical protein